MREFTILLRNARAAISIKTLLGVIVGGAMGLFFLGGDLFYDTLIGASVVGFIVLVLSIISAAVCHYSDDTICEPEMLVAATNAPVFAFVPHCTGQRNKKSAKLSQLAESYYMLRNNIEYCAKGTRVFVVTSASSGDGKTTVAINLAKALVSSGKKIAIIDADMRNPSVHKRFRLHNRYGLADVLMHNAEAGFVRLRDCPSLYVLCAGNDMKDHSALLKSNRMKELINQSLELFDYIIIDAPPILPVPDCAALAQVVQKILFVARHGCTIGKDVKRAKYMLEISNKKIMGCVLNDVPVKECKQYAKYYD